MITIADLVERFGEQEIAELSDHENRSVIDDSVVMLAITDAESDVESYLNATGLVARNVAGALIYTKSAIVPKSLIIKTCDIARWYLHEDQMTDVPKRRYDEAIAWLKLVMKNPAMLTGLDDKNGNTDGINSGIYVMPNPVPSMWKD